jgi:hypothetical protein
MNDDLALLVLGVGLHDEEGALALVVQVLDAAVVGERGVDRDGLADLEVLLAVEEHHRVELEARNAQHVREIGERHAERGQHREAITVLIGELELGRVGGILGGADGQGVEHHLLLSVLHLGDGELEADHLVA